jgi:hypothetical protein
MKVSLVESVDYVMENNKMVFTKEFLLKRGYCCNAKCRNCPYKVSNKKIENNNYELVEGKKEEIQ